jgi:hypothetical protein
MKRIAILAVLLIISIFVGTEVVSVVDANPFGLAKQIDTPSDAKPPIISISSPQSNTDYSGTFNISFSVKQPQYYSKSAIVDIIYTIDNVSATIPHQYWTVIQGSGSSQYSTSIIAPTLAAGNHSLRIRAQGASYDFYNFFLIDGYSQVYFTVSDNSTQNNKTPTQDAGSDNKVVLPTIPLVAIISLIVIIAAASASIVYFKRRKKLTNH